MPKKELSQGEKYFFGFVADILKYAVFIPAIKETNTFGFWIGTILGAMFILTDLYVIYKLRSFRLIITSLITGEILDN